MIFRVHYTIDGYEDSFVVVCETVEEGREQAKKFMDDRGIVPNNCWSERMPEIYADTL